MICISLAGDERVCSSEGRGEETEEADDEDDDDDDDEGEEREEEVKEEGVVVGVEVSLLLPSVYGETLGDKEEDDDDDDEKGSGDE